MLALNTKLTGYAGVLAFVVGLLAYGPFQAALTKLVPAAVLPWLAPIFIAAGFAGAYFGKPATVPEGPSTLPQPAAAVPQKDA